jgi:predicted acylesterase/phospholipase RssA
LGENENESKAPAANGSQFIALALSGGGSRAIAFHLGCLRALHDRGVLDKVRVISSVSGGSVIAAAYCPSSDNLRPIRRFAKGDSGSSGVRV